MKKLLFLLAVAAFSLNCGGSAANTGNANKPANAANTTANANKPASTPAPSNSAGDSKMGNEDLDFTLVNKTGYDIKSVSVGPTGDKDWTPEDEVLKGRAFKNGESLDIKFHPKETAQNWDLKVEWTDGSPSVEWLKLNLTKIEKVTLNYDKASDKTTAVIE